LCSVIISDVKDETIDLSNESLLFKGKSGGKDYEVNIEFFKKVDSDGSTYKVLPRSVQMHIMKHEDDKEEFWPRLLQDKALEKNQVKLDWDRYVDEDEEQEGFDTAALDGGKGMGGMPPGMGGGGMPGMGGMGGGGMPGLGGMPGMEGMGGGGMGGMDMEALMKQMGGMGGMPGMGGDEGAEAGEIGDGDDDDDDLPDLEES
jgi:prostaglandin-E synthase